MTSRDMVLTTVAIDLVAALSLGVGMVYSVENLSTTATLLIREQRSQPIGLNGAKTEAGSEALIQPGNEGIWCWTDDPSGVCPILVTPAPI